jgi:ATP-dependent Clp protease ATP-binding subunit ClpA
VDSNLYNYFSFSAKKAIYRASEVCQQFGNQFVEPEHIFFSMLQLRSCSAVQILQRLNVNLAKLTYSLEAALYERAGDYKGTSNFSARSLALLDASFREVKKSKHREIGTAHLLIALAQEQHAVLRELFAEHVISADPLRRTFIEHLRGYHAERDAEEGTTHAPAVAGWPPGINETIAVGKIPVTPGRSFNAEAVSLLAGAAQLATVFRQPGIGPPELLGALLIGASKPLSSLAILLKLDTVALLATLVAYWQQRALPADTAPAQLALSPELASMLGRAFAQMLAEAGQRAHGPLYAISADHLLLALLDEPSDPLRDWLEQQGQDNAAFNAALAKWREDRKPARAVAEPEPALDAAERAGLAAGLESILNPELPGEAGTGSETGPAG